MLYSTLLHSTVLALYTTVLYCILLYCHCTLLYSTVMALNSTLLYCTGTVLYCTILYSPILYCTLLYSIVFSWYLNVAKFPEDSPGTLAHCTAAHFIARQSELRMVADVVNGSANKSFAQTCDHAFFIYIYLLKLNGL